MTPHCGAPNDALRHHGALGTTSAQGAVAQERGTQATEAEEEVAVASFIELAQRVVGEARNQEFDAILRRRERTRERGVGSARVRGRRRGGHDRRISIRTDRGF